MKLRDLAEFLLLAALGSTSFLFMRIAAPALGPVWLIEARVLISGLILLPWLVRGGLIDKVRQNSRPLLIVGILNSAIPFLLFAFAALWLPAGMSSILNATAPLSGVALAAIWFKESITFSRMVGFILGFVGVVILIGWKQLQTTPAFLLAVVAGLLGAFMYAIAAPYTKQHLAGVPALVITTGSQLSAAFILLPLLPFTIPKNPPTITVIFSVLGLALLSTAFTYFLYFRLIERVGPTRALTVTYLTPLFAMLWGSLILQESITFSMLLGCALILLGIATANGLLT